MPSPFRDAKIFLGELLMKKLILFCSASLLVSIPLFAQESKSDLMKQVAKETCVELSNNDFSKMNSDQVKVTMGVSMIKVVARHLTEFEPFGGVNLSDSQSMDKLVFEVGVLLSGDCPGIAAAVTANANAFNEVG